MNKVYTLTVTYGEGRNALLHTAQLVISENTEEHIKENIAAFSHLMELARKVLKARDGEVILLSKGEQQAYEALRDIASNLMKEI